MTEREWLAGTHYWTMLDQVKSKRKRLLFGCAVARQVWPLVTRKCNRLAVETTERFADGLVSRQEFEQAWLGIDWEPAMYCEWHLAVTDECQLPSTENLDGTLSRFPQRRPLEQIHREWTEALREVTGNPFRLPVLQPHWVLASDQAARRLARVIYDERRFEDLPVLADALEEAGCNASDLLEHLRRPGGHALGCWPLDLVLGLA